MDPMRRTLRRDWLTFRLRTLLLLVFVVSCWLGWQLKLVRDRKAFLTNVIYSGPANYITNPRPHSDLMFYRKWLGDINVERIDTWNEADAKRADQLFPELRELYFVDTDNMIKNYDADRSVVVATQSRTAP